MIKRLSNGQYSRDRSVRTLAIITASVGLVWLFLWLSPPIEPIKAVQADTPPHGCTRVAANELYCDLTPDALKARMSEFVEWKEPNAEDETIPALIRRISAEEGLSEEDTDLAIDIARCESNFNPLNENRKNNKPVGSVDRGLFQFSSHHWKSIPDSCAYSAECSTREAVRLIKADKAWLWVCYRLVR